MEEAGGEVDKTTTIYVFPYHTNEEGEKSEEKVEVSTSDVVEEVTTATEEEVTTQYVEEVVEIDNENVIVANVMAASENGSIKLVLSEEDSNLEEHGYTTSYRPIRPVERQKMRPWLLDHLDQGSIPGLSWQNRQQRIFRISWKHAAHNCFDKIRDSDLFERWAYHTGRHHDGNHKRWKANFRCALNSLPDVIELRDLGVRKGDNAFKVYKFIDLTDEKEREEKKRLQMVTRQSKKGDKKGGSGIGSPLFTPKQIKKDPHSPAAFSITTSDGGMLQTLLHAIELKNKEAASGGSDTPKEKVQVTVKRTAHPSTESKQSKRIKIERARENSESTESSDETDDETESQESMKSENTDSTPNTPTSGQNVLSTLKLPLIDMRQLLAHVTAGKMQFAGADKSEETQNLKVTIPCTVLEALQARKLITEPVNKQIAMDNKEKTVIPQTTEETTDKTASTDQDVKLMKTELNKDMPKLAAALNKPLQPVPTSSGTNVRPQLVSKLNISGAQETRRQVVRNRLATKINTGAEQGMYEQMIKDNVVSSGDKVMGGNVGSVLLTQSTPSQSFEKVTVQAIPQLQTVSLADNLQEGKTGTQGSSCEEEELLPENAESHKSDTSTAMDINVENVVVSTPDATSTSLSNQVTIDLADLTEENLSAEVTGELEEKQFHVTVAEDGGKQTIVTCRGRRSVMTHCNLYTCLRCQNLNAERLMKQSDNTWSEQKLSHVQWDSLHNKKLIKAAVDILATSSEYKGLNYKVINKSQSALIITNSWYFGVLGEDLDPVTLTLTGSGQLIINVLFKPLEKLSVLTSTGELDKELFNTVLNKMTKYVFCPGLLKYCSITVLPQDFPHMKMYEQPFVRYHSMGCPVWYNGTKDSLIPIKMCGECETLHKKLNGFMAECKEDGERERVDEDHDDSVEIVEDPNQIKASETEQTIISDDGIMQTVKVQVVEITLDDIT